MSSVVEVLTKARALVAQGHCKGAAARAANGRPVRVNEPGACSWCALGAMWASESWEHVENAKDTLRSVLGVRSIGSIGRWNDAPERTQAEVVDAFDRAIAAEVARVSE
jgi:hypothetical protein